MTEQAIQKKITNFLTDKWYQVVKLIKTNVNWVPDLMVLTWDEKMFFVEVKTEKGKLSPLQIFRIKKLEENWYKVIVPYWYDDFINKYEEYEKNNLSKDN